MAFVILSTGPVTASRLLTLRASTLLGASALLLLLVLAAGMGVGYRYAHVESAGAPAPALARDLERPERRALIDRIGTLSGRVIELESQAQTLADRIETIEGPPKASPQPPAPEDPAAPKGGPFLPVTGTTAWDDDIGLAKLERDLDQVGATLDVVEAATAPRELASMAFPNRPPIAGRRITSGFGIRVDPFTGRRARHTGIDIGAPVSTPIRAAGGGRVTFAGFRSAYGYMVEIEHEHGLRTRYGHASRLLVRRGDVVLPEQAIAVVGSTGRSTGPHVHFEVLRNGVPVEPRTYLRRGA